MQIIHTILSLILFITLFTSDTTKAMNKTAEKIRIPMYDRLKHAVENNDTKTLDTVVAQCSQQKIDVATCINAQRASEPSFFITAIQKRHVEIVRKLIELGGQVGTEALEVAIANQQPAMVACLLERRVTFVTYNNGFIRTFTQTQIHEDIAKIFLTRIPTNHMGIFAGFIANLMHQKNNYTPKIKRFLAHTHFALTGKSITFSDEPFVDPEGNNALHTMAEMGHDLGVGLIGSRKPSPSIYSALNHAGNTPIHVALKSSDENYLVIAQFLLTYPEVVKVRDARGATPLHTACYRKQVDVVQLLLTYATDLESGPDAEMVVNERIVTPWSIAQSNGMLELPKALEIKLGAQMLKHCKLEAQVPFFKLAIEDQTNQLEQQKDLLAKFLPLAVSEELARAPHEHKLLEEYNQSLNGSIREAYDRSLQELTRKETERQAFLVQETQQRALLNSALHHELHEAQGHWSNHKQLIDFAYTTEQRAQNYNTQMHQAAAAHHQATATHDEQLRQASAAHKEELRKQTTAHKHALTEQEDLVRKVRAEHVTQEKGYQQQVAKKDTLIQKLLVESKTNKAARQELMRYQKELLARIKTCEETLQRTQPLPRDPKLYKSQAIMTDQILCSSQTIMTDQVFYNSQAVGPDELYTVTQPASASAAAANDDDDDDDDQSNIACDERPVAHTIEAFNQIIVNELLRSSEQLGAPVLYTAIWFNMPPMIIRYLLACEQDPFEEHDGYNAFHWAIYYGHSAIINALLVDPSTGPYRDFAYNLIYTRTHGGTGCSPLCIARDRRNQNGNWEITNLLLSLEANGGACPFHGY